VALTPLIDCPSQQKTILNISTPVATHLLYQFQLKPYFVLRKMSFAQLRTPALTSTHAITIRANIKIFATLHLKPALFPLTNQKFQESRLLATALLLSCSNENSLRPKDANGKEVINRDYKLTTQEKLSCKGKPGKLTYDEIHKSDFTGFIEFKMMMNH